MTTDHDHEWKSVRFGPVNDGYGHLSYSESEYCAICGELKPCSWKTRIFGWGLVLIIAFLLFAICMGWGVQ